ncbi:hypothetical protein [Kocuria dechangensis]|uniref:hypothetical protein n=1 Tax=Kocuria dechangensis TaxID=1176249 RepID=UPI00166D394C|nr:hypothetical protein [Kocuria dechangensis]
MDRHARGADGDATADEGTSLPTARQVLVRALPAAAIMMIGIPVLAWWLVDAAGGMTTRWWPLPLLAFLGLVGLVHHFAQAPPPPFDRRASNVRWPGALSSAGKFGTVPTDPDVRTTAGVVPCTDVETIVVVAPFVLGGAFALLIRPEFPWSEAITPIAITLVFVFTSRHGWAYLKVLHPKPPAG